MSGPYKTASTVGNIMQRLVADRPVVATDKWGKLAEGSNVDHHKSQIREVISQDIMKIYAQVDTMCSHRARTMGSQQPSISVANQTQKPESNVSTPTMKPTEGSAPTLTM